MNPLTVPVLSSGESVNSECQWTLFTEGRTFECEVCVIKEDIGFSAHCATLPGVVGEGETVDEAVIDIAAALQEVLSEYRTAGSIPWSENKIEGEIECKKWILINV